MQSYQPATLGSLSAEGRRVYAYCRTCQHKALLNPRNLGLPPDQLVPGLGRVMRCSKCGSKRVYTAPDYIREEARRMDRGR